MWVRLILILCMVGGRGVALFIGNTSWNPDTNIPLLLTLMNVSAIALFALMTLFAVAFRQRPWFDGLLRVSLLMTVATLIYFTIHFFVAKRYNHHLAGSIVYLVCTLFFAALLAVSFAYEIWLPTDAQEEDDLVSTTISSRAIHNQPDRPSEKERAVRGWFDNTWNTQIATSLTASLRWQGGPKWQEPSGNSSVHHGAIRYEALFRSGKLASPKAFESRPAKQYPGFIRCACCVNKDEVPFTPSSDQDTESGPQPLDDSTEAFISNGQAEYSRVKGLPYDRRAHQYCSMCLRICHGAHAFLGPWTNMYEFEKNIGTLFGHWQAPSLLVQSARTCHLCALLVSRLNEEQLKSLLEGDDALASQQWIEDAVQPAQETRTIREAYNSFRPISVRMRVVPQPPSAGGDRLVLIPHFGACKVPRGWTRGIRGFPDADMSIGMESKQPLALTFGQPTDGSL